MTPSPILLLLLGVLTTLALASIARSRERLRPLVWPWALSAAGLVLMAYLQKQGRMPVGESVEALVSLAWLLPPLVLVVRACVILALALFQRRQGIEPPELLGSVISIALYAVGVGTIASRWFGVDLTPFLATSAVLGAVVGLAMQDTLGNLFAGIALHTQSPFRVGDWVRFGDKDGRVEQVSWRAVQLRTWDGDTLTVPNNESARHPILNYSVPRQPHSRVINVGVTYATPPDKVFAVLSTVLDQVEGLPPDPRSIRLVTYGDSAQIFEVRYPFHRYEDWRRFEHEINRLIWYHFRRAGIVIPFPIRDVHLQRAARPTSVEETAAARLERTLRQIDLFGTLSDDEFRRALDHFRPLHYAAGERIIEEGAPGGSFFVVDRGQVEVSKTLAGGSRPIAQLSQGQVFGEMALLTGEARTATVVALSDVDLFTIDKAGFHGIIAANPQVAEDISRILAERREALVQAEGDASAPLEAEGGRDRSLRILQKIRGYFGL